MLISLIAAVAANQTIGRTGSLPWHLPADLARFRQLTWGHPVIMGRITFDTLGKPLPGRLNIVITRQNDYPPRGCLVVHGMEAALTTAAATGTDEVFICGGGQIYRDMIHRADRLYITRVQQNFYGDTVFPAIPPELFALVEETPSPDTIPCIFQRFERRPTTD